MCSGANGKDCMETFIEGPSLKCIYCPHARSVAKDDDMINHLVDEEYILEVEVLKYIKENKMKNSQLYEKAALTDRVVEVIEEESDEPLDKRMKKDDESPRKSLKELEVRTHCKKCNCEGENLELL